MKIWIEDLEKKMIKAWECDLLPTGRWNLSIDSRRVKVAGNLMPKNGEAKHTSKSAAKETVSKAQQADGNTSQQQTRIDGGQPVHVVATIYTESNLRLLPANEKYRALIIAAGQKYSLTPQSIAALIDAEAARSKDGGWREDSNESSPDKAQGLAQFFRAAWTDVFNMQISLLCQDCKTMGKEQWMKKRLEAKYAIDGAAAYACLNLRNFASATGFDVEGLAPEDKAKIAYLVHHEGLTGARRLVQGFPEPYTNEKALARLELQMGASGDASRYVEQYRGNSVEAYKGWLFDYIDKKINVQHFTVQGAENLTKAARNTADIVASLSGQAASPPPQPRKKDPSLQTSVPPTTRNPGPSSTDADASLWFDPLEICTIRTAHLASKRSAEFGWTRDNEKRAHKGLDLAAEPGTPVRAVANGIVHFGPMPKSGADYGNTLVLVVGINDLPPDHAELFRRDNPDQQTIGFFYAHLSEYEHEVQFASNGEPISIKVNAGDVIAKTGCTGNAKGMTSIPLGAHLHFEVRQIALLHCKGLTNRVNPLPYIVNCTNP
ncbi:M23 family metallopeptidase [Caballeronia sp. GAFFF1]|uniref:M23 family metallopeptidase n=1 Tax=Caballeronia sp. GAFFF1 TaxID=2921779 RepID=UPI0020287519|nr:M23 family metallopeptidase [Caballeronia sp. GAFFF1]